MKYRKTWSVFIILIIILAVGCSEQKDSEELQLGKYVKQDTEKPERAWVLLLEDNQFQFIRSNATSYTPCGTYEAKDDTLILTVSEKEVYRFSINGEKLILKDDIGNLLKGGDIFKYTVPNAE
jgi:hypothetical protein